MRTACIYHDTFVNKIMRDLVELEIYGMQCQCPRQPSLTIRSRAWLLDTGGDLLVGEPRRHRTADLSKAKLSAVRSHPIVVL